MRIAYLTQSYPPMVSGSAGVTEQLATELSKRGHPVLVIGASDKDQPYLTLQKNLTVLRLGSIYNPLRVRQRFLIYPRRAVLRALNEFQPDVIHAHEPLQISWLGLEYAHRVSIPITMTAHQLPWFAASYLPDVFGIRPQVEIFLWMYARWLLGKFTTILAPTQTISTLIKQMTGLDSNVISCGLDLQMFRPPLSSDDEAAIRQKWNLPPRLPLLLHVGRLDTDKSVDQVVRAAAQTIRESEAHLLIVGDGIQKSGLIKLCKLLGVVERVHFTGYVSLQNGLAEIYRIADVFVTASEIETQGIVLLEAAASGLPIVAVRATCIPEIVYDRVNGYLTKAGDIHAMSESILKILSDPGMAKSMGKASRALAEGHPNHATFEEHERIYHKMVRDRGTQQTTAREREALPWKPIKERFIWEFIDRFR